MKLVLADDHTMFREGLHALLGTIPDMHVVAQAATGADAVTETVRHNADAVILDVEMPGQSVFATVAALRRQRPHTRIVVLTMHQDDALRRDLLTRGVTAYLSKTDPVDTVADALRTDHHSLPTNSANAAPLSDRELEVLTLVASALTNQQVAQHLNLAPGTIKRHLANISDKLGAVSRLDAVRKAHLLGLL
ncbi:response regulator transcription factor [Curtobacterium sp. MCBD17_040]|uniref:response regulator transcription factor n=1 Tax=Curtobacterium sp. MCBD17_040 TaxID=2175674 RepID=UPI000DA8CDF9|nr:response regulator transcription factor [Curtobacterium sp. MCBD17_040]WIB65514.1 response regulator transcription factor [Curtobacterium sp. MCBD17_040]